VASGPGPGSWAHDGDVQSQVERDEKSVHIFVGLLLGVLVAAVGLGAVFLWQAWRLWQQGSSEEGSTAGAIRLYKYSISYLTLLFAAVAVDAVVLSAVA